MATTSTNVDPAITELERRGVYTREKAEWIARVRNSYTEHLSPEYRERRIVEPTFDPGFARVRVELQGQVLGYENEIR